MTENKMPLFFAGTPGLEAALCAEAAALGFDAPRAVPGGVESAGTWRDVWRANLMLRGAARVLVRVGGFPVFHLAQLDKRSRKFGWAQYLRPDTPVRVEVTCRKSKIYHAGAAAQRIENAIAQGVGAEITQDAPVRLLARIDNNFCTFSIDSSGEPLHRRGHKQAVGKAPMRETLAAMFLHECGFAGAEPVLDPMCGSGTFVIEAAEMAAQLAAGRSRGFAFQHLAGHDEQAWQEMRGKAQSGQAPAHRFFGSDRDQGAARMAAGNAQRAKVAAWCEFACRPAGQLTRPEGQPGLVIVNPPYGARIGNKKPLYALHAGLGEVLKSGFGGWRVGLITTDRDLAYATGLPFQPPGPPVAHGGLKVKLYQTGAL